MKYKKKMKQGKVTQTRTDAGGYYGGMSEMGAKAEHKRLKEYMAKFHVKTNVPQFSKTKWDTYQAMRTSCWCNGNVELHRTASGRFRTCTATHRKGEYDQWVEIDRPHQEEE
jgi:hypothetical protein